MELRIKPYNRNLYPIGGVLIKGPSVAYWIMQLQEMQLALNTIKIYPVPGTTANSIWGCLVVTNRKIETAFLGRNELCQAVSPNLFTPERTILYPAVTNVEIEKLFASGKHIFHPEIGLAELSEELDLNAVLMVPEMRSYFVTRPADSVFIPMQAKSFQVYSVPAEEVLANMDEHIFPKHKELKDEPLNFFEKARLALYKMLFSSKENDKKPGNTGAPGGTGLFGKIGAFIESMIGGESKWANKIYEDLENLEQRNQSQIDKLMDMFKNNLEEALKYAIPLDTTGGNRGGDDAAINLSKWHDFSLFGNYTSSGNAAGGLDKHYFELQKQYNAAAEALIQQKEYKKAAFVYMKLLKNYTAAAQTLETGKYYQEAATIYLKHLENKPKAAECYEKGNMIIDAIELYIELEENEKVGDLYAGIGKRKQADVYFEKVVDNYRSKDQFLKASLIYREKMHRPEAGQSMLLEGWRTNKDAFNCLNNYFANIEDVKTLGIEIRAVYARDVDHSNRQIFLQAMRHEYAKDNELAESIKEIAYEIVAAHAVVNPSIVSELRAFNAKDKELTKDTTKFIQNPNAGGWTGKRS